MLLPTPFLDISNRVLRNGEAGLLSLAFHPQYASGQPFVFVHFIEDVTAATNGANINGEIVVERYRVSNNDSNLLDPTSAESVIRIPHATFNNHYGGRVAFGPDGMLYLSTGDGGGGGDNLMNGQNAATLLGKLLRLDVSTLPYTIPPDNPTWPSTPQARRENWAIGLRNPFRYAFDAPTGRLYIADVGQSAREEVNVVDVSASGLNYGWNIMEGGICYFGYAGTCPVAGLTGPVYDFDHDQGCAIIGGYVYRGAAMPELEGQYLFSDVCGGFVRSLSIEGGGVAVRQAPMASVGVVLSFGQDGFGELYIMTLDNRILRVVRP